ncbi:hypothetical protein Sj15T_12000 [Sphingobium sp. TA15]|uniref:ABC-type transport system permease component n=1 Tax=Sphingobium indicum (strain DSM 16413 / CCM 7287 / MTCC 6362 / UT26 / NBRC 101211 / UT26S) TaxID=452662 RepID=D4Z2B2_SPHIU|nr:DUF3526 domain-containing protein [Sphingobium indicum]BAI96744.1 ABC-type transport system permease component [Sphingobium indicum UT26S]BDD66179.1 hypothetical protein Sj15T_12000 [Sphingobium sp. TA15]
MSNASRPIRVIALHELSALWRDGRLRIAAGVALLLLLVALVSGAQYQRALSAERTQADQVERERWLNQGPKNPHSAAHYGVYAFKPASPLVLFDRGVEPFVGVGVWLEAHKMNGFVYRPAQDAGPASRFGDLSAATILRQLVPLIIILAGYAMFAGERERGTLRQLLVSGITRTRIGLGKLGAILLGAGLILAPAVLGGVAAAAIEPTAPELGRIFLLLLAYIVWLAGWTCLTLAVSALARTARSALVILLSVWLFGCILGPRLASEVAARVAPVPSEMTFRDDLEKDLGASHSSEQANKIKARILKQYGVASTAELPFDWRGISLQEGEEHGNTVFDKHFGALFDTYQVQNRWLQAIGFLAPELAIRTISQSAAGTDFAHHRRFVAAAEAHRRLMQRLLNREVLLHDREGTEYRSAADFWKNIPAFHYVQPRLTMMLGGIVPALLALAFWLAGTAFLFWFALRRLRA